MLRRPLSFLFFAATLSLFPAAISRGDEDTVGRGLPPTRLYPFEEIGNVPRRVHLTFDPFGRLAAVYDQVYAVLNDTAWLNLEQDVPGRVINLSTASPAKDGRTYFCGRGVWGTLQVTPEGHLHLSPLPATRAPDWAKSSAFSQILSTPEGVVFASDRGVVFWNFTTGATSYFWLESMSRVFAVGPRLFASCYGNRLLELHPSDETTTSMDGAVFDNQTFEQSAELDESATLISTAEGRLYLFNGNVAVPWRPQEQHAISGRITALQALPDGAVALALADKGIFVVARTGEIIASLPTAGFQRVSYLASNEAGVLWATTEDGVVKILYREPITIFGQRLGLPASWPRVARWNHRIVIATGMRLYISQPEAADSYTRFQPWKTSPELAAWTVAANQDQLLLGNATGVYSLSPDGAGTRVAAITGVQHLFFVAEDRCFAIGDKEIALLHWVEGRWEESVARVPSPGNAPVAHASHDAVWLEFGGNRVARVGFDGTKLVVRDFHDLPWSDSSWVSVGVVGHTIVMTASGATHIYFDEDKMDWTDAPELDALLRRSPYWITRVFQDSTGALWGTHHKGVVKFVPRDRDYNIDATSFELVSEQFPVLQILRGDDVWISSGGSLYHTQPNSDTASFPSVRPPVLVSLMDGARGIEPARVFGEGHAGLILPNDHRSLAFRFFSGSYGGKRVPRLIYRLNESGDWEAFDSGTLLRLDELREGRHILEVRQSDFAGQPSATTRLSFEIKAPWQRTLPAYILYVVAAFLTIFGAVKLSRREMRRRNRELERIVHERTSALEAAMAKLSEETRNAAIFAERNRLAGEIHDSLQQGLSGLMFQLDATLKLTEMSREIRTRLSTAREMVSFTRREVQHVVWDLGTPLLNGAELHDALRKMATLLASGSVPLELIVTGPAVPMSPASKHHLLRIAQEAITNAIRHASATKIQIVLTYGRGEVVLTVVDNGVGFSMTDVVDDEFGHFGLRGMHERAVKFGGSVTVKSVPGSGTTVKVLAPITSPVEKT